MFVLCCASVCILWCLFVFGCLCLLILGYAVYFCVWMCAVFVYFGYVWLLLFMCVYLCVLCFCVFVGVKLGVHINVLLIVCIHS